MAMIKEPMPSQNAHWRDSARAARFFIIDAKAAFPIFLFLLHIRIWTFVLAVAVTFFFTFLNRFGYSIAVFLRITRAFFAGPRKIAVPWWI
jgi:intracellular multiplication protein IcmT